MADRRLCDHCLLPVPDNEDIHDDLPEGRKVFCCRACRSIHRMIREEGLQDFYRKRDWQTAGIPDALRTERSGGLESLQAVPAGTTTVQEAQVLIDGIRCASCVWLNEKVLERTDGVLKARVNFATHRAVITWDNSRTTFDRILARIRSIGYLARPYSLSDQEALLQKQDRDLLLRLGTAFFFSMQLMLFSAALYAGFFQGIDTATKHILEYVSFAVCTPVLFYSGWPFLQGAARSIRNRTPNMDTLVALGALSAYLLSIAHMFSGREVYFDTSAMIITLVLLGRYLENSAKRRASQAVSRLLSLQPRDARVRRCESWVSVPVEEAHVGDLLEVRPGEKVPLDGVVVEGESEADESLVTGESRPVDKRTGSPMIGGSTNGLGRLTMTVTRIGGDTVIAQITRLVENAQAQAAPIQRLADRVSAWFVPAVLLLATATYGYWLTVDEGAPSQSLALMNAVAVLVIACPCALGLATPVAILAATGSAARSGILIKGGDVLERLHKVRHLVLDKTGTVTTGLLHVESAETPTTLSDRRRLLQLAASAEQASEHLLGRAIVRHAREREVELLAATSARALPGQGIEAMVEERTVLVGKADLLVDRGIDVPQDLLDRAALAEQQGRTVVFAAMGSELLGFITLADSPKPDAAETVAALGRAGLSVVMITGDNRPTAEAIARETGIGSVFAGVLPEGKASAVRELREKRREAVAMVGDGINDAPALASADVGIALATGSDIAVESAGVVLMGRQLRAVSEVVLLSRRTFRIITQNLFWAFFYNLAALPLAMTGVLHPIVAAAAMAVSSVTVVLNSLRLR